VFEVHSLGTVAKELEFSPLEGPGVPDASESYRSWENLKVISSGVAPEAGVTEDTGSGIKPPVPRNREGSRKAVNVYRWGNENTAGGA